MRHTRKIMHYIVRCTVIRRIIGKAVKIRCSPRYCETDRLFQSHWVFIYLGRQDERADVKPGDLPYNIAVAFRRERERVITTVFCLCNIVFSQRFFLYERAAVIFCFLVFLSS